ncbi:TPA: hypothetical protein ENX78_08560 [Candidatus Poribacteria bacterium]|nr:hypothetical protein [Candidatus Poribacteria bacterium]
MFEAIISFIIGVCITLFAIVFGRKSGTNTSTEIRGGNPGNGKLFDKIREEQRAAKERIENSERVLEQNERVISDAKDRISKAREILGRIKQGIQNVDD